MNLGDWTKLLLTFVLGSLIGGPIGGCITYRLNAKSPHLTVAVEQPVQFQGDKATIGIINFSVVSDGSMEAEKIECMFRTGAAKIQEVKATPESIKPSVKTDGNKVTVTVDNLNVGEKLFVSTYVTESSPDKPDVSVRGKGVVGESTPPQRHNENWTFLYFLGGIVVFGFYVLCERILFDRISRIAARKYLGKAWDARAASVAAHLATAEALKKQGERPNPD
jgi:hypothetical protein